ncbi:hypothetical protein [Methyloglobulus morosus]|nr:hypothetical protein [Methyloglobulus morosus]
MNVHALFLCGVLLERTTLVSCLNDPALLKGLRMTAFGKCFPVGKAVAK